MSAEMPGHDRLLKPAEVAKITSLSRATIDRLRRRGEFVAAVALTPGRIAFSESAVRTWIAAKVAAAA